MRVTIPQLMLKINGALVFVSQQRIIYMELEILWDKIEVTGADLCASYSRFYPCQSISPRVSVASKATAATMVLAASSPACLAMTPRIVS